MLDNGAIKILRRREGQQRRGDELRTPQLYDLLPVSRLRVSDVCEPRLQITSDTRWLTEELRSGPLRCHN